MKRKTPYSQLIGIALLTKIIMDHLTEKTIIKIMLYMIGGFTEIQK